MGRSRGYFGRSGLYLGIVHVQPRSFGHAHSSGTGSGRGAPLMVPLLRDARLTGDGGRTFAMKLETVAYKRSRFSTRLPVRYLYTPSHYWLRETEPGVWQIGF